MKKALVVNPYWDTMGGGERYCAFVAKCLLDFGWIVDLMTHHDPRPEIASKFGIDIHPVSLVNQDVYTANYRLLFWLTDGSLPTSFAAKTIIHFQFPFSVARLSISDKIKVKAYTSVTNSAFTKKFIDKAYGFNSKVLYPPVAVQSFKPGRKINQILYVGRFSQLTQKKNHHLLIEAFKLLDKKFINWKLVLAGGSGVGTDVGYLEDLQKSSKGKNIEIITNPSFEKIKSLYSQSKIFWSASGFGSNEESDPTQVEHFGISLVEAMSAGCVPLVSNLGGHKEIIINGVCGYLCNDIDEMAKLTNQICLNQKKYQELASQAIERSKLFSESAFRESLKKII